MQRHKKLKARILSLALSVAMIVTMMPATVFAAEGDVPLGASSVVDSGNAPLDVATRDVRANAITIDVNNGTTAGGATLEAALNGQTLTAVTSLKITAGKVTTTDWNYLTNLSAMTSFEIDESISNGNVADIPSGTFSDPTFPTSIVSVTVPQAIAIGSNAFVGCTALATVSFPVATSISNGVFAQCTKFTTLKLGATPPQTIGTSAFTNCPDTRALGYVNASGDLTGTDLTTAQAAYKAIDDGNTTDNLWYGWTIAAATTHVPVTGITGVPTVTPAGTPLTLSGTVSPTNATNKTIVWTCKECRSHWRGHQRQHVKHYGGGISYRDSDYHQRSDRKQQLYTGFYYHG